MADLLGIVLLLASFFISIQTVFGSATFSIRFVHFTNPGGLGSNGHCCDGRAGFCLTPCDHIFTTCLDHGTSWSRDANVCPHGKRQSSKITNQDSITFGRLMGGIRNPMTFRFDMWPGSVKIKVKVWDYDAVGLWDDVDYLQKTVSLTPSPSASTAEEELELVQSRTQLTVELKLFCDPHFYGPACAVYCSARDDYDGHYTCDPSTGHKDCHAGWTGEDCNLAFNECGSFPCQNGGLCIDDHNSFSCKCEVGYTGDRCEIDIDECASSPCENGGVCEDMVDGFVCVCDEGFGGTNCESQLPACYSSPCLNNGTCQDINGTHYNCTCMEGFSGDDCELQIFDTDALPPSGMEPRESFGMSVSAEGRLGESDEAAIKEWTKKKMTETGRISGDLVDVTVRMQPCTGDKGVLVTEIFILIHYPSHGMSLDDLEFSMGLINRALKFDFLYKRYDGQECNAGFISARKTTVENSWIADNWLVIALLAVGLVVLALVIAGVIFFKRRRQWQRGSHSEHAVTYDCIGNTSPGTSPIKHMTDDEITQSFGNALYFDPMDPNKESMDQRDSAFDEDDDIYQVVD
ncbi:protein jagged-1-like [Lineus longissimus]|uniref:protein jagged-1-like n=1 Tax=Lineus longissimus TaxID=88925 RepID=UPI002B4E9966